MITDLSDDDSFYESEYYLTDLSFGFGGGRDPIGSFAAICPLGFSMCVLSGGSVTREGEYEDERVFRGSDVWLGRS